MPHGSFPTVLPALALAALCALAPGCKSSGPDKAQRTADSLTEVENSLRAVSNQIGVATESLNRIVAQPDGDLRPGYDAFVNALSSLESGAKQLAGSGSKMKSRAQAYYADWEKSLASIQSEDIRERSDKRRKELLEGQQEANERFDAFEEQFNQFVGRLQDIRAFLGHDLNRAGVESISGEAKKAAKEGKDLQSTIDKFAAKLTDVRKAVSAQGPATPEA